MVTGIRVAGYGETSLFTVRSVSRVMGSSGTRGAASSVRMSWPGNGPTIADEYLRAVTWTTSAGSVIASTRLTFSRWMSSPIQRGSC